MSVLPHRPKGPPLNAMRAFEAAARHVSFIAAADELSVTPGAISQHVKTLETWAGVSLFRRHAQGVELTAAGRSLLRDFTQAFDALAIATHRLRNLHPNAELHIAALPSIAQLWLPPRLARIRKARPDLNISVTAMETPPSLGRELFDLSVFFAAPDAGADQIVLGDDEIFPVCAPTLAKRISSPADLNSMVLLHDQTWNEDWTLWTKQSGISLDDPRKGPKYSLYSLAVEEAKSGAGVLMGHARLIEDALRSGQLVVIFEERALSRHSLVLNLPHKSRRHPEVDAIVTLLKDEFDTGQGQDE